jgi:heme-degrading monooxygenase HmoA
MIARSWRGWTRRENSDTYEKLLRDTVPPGLQAIPGYHGGHVLRRDLKEESEFVVVNFFVSLDALRQFAGPSYDIPVFQPEAKRLLSRIEAVATHYEVRIDTLSGHNH